jgi:hypothetical protein
VARARSLCTCRAVRKIVYRWPQPCTATSCPAAAARHVLPARVHGGAGTRAGRPDRRRAASSSRNAGVLAESGPSSKVRATWSGRPSPARRGNSRRRSGPIAVMPGPACAIASPAIASPATAPAAAATRFMVIGPLSTNCQKYSEYGNMPGMGGHPRTGLSLPGSPVSLGITQCHSDWAARALPGCPASIRRIMAMSGCHKSSHGGRRWHGQGSAKGFRW